MKKRGFTLVELLAVIAILAILVIMALPAVLRMFQQARIDSFNNELNTLIRTAEQQYLLSGGQPQTFSRSSNPLSLTGNASLDYCITIDGTGKITNFNATNGDYKYKSNGIIDQTSSNDIETAESGYTLNCSSGTPYIVYVTRQNEGQITVEDEVAIGSEHFYVISTDSTETVLFAKYNLYVGDQFETNGGSNWTKTGTISSSDAGYGLQNESAKGYNSTDSTHRIGTVAFSGKGYWDNADCIGNGNGPFTCPGIAGLKGEYANSSNAEGKTGTYLNPFPYVYRSNMSSILPSNTYGNPSFGGPWSSAQDNGYTIAYYVEEYINTLKSFGASNNIKGRLLKFEEVSSLSNSIKGNWSYWLGSAYSQYTAQNVYAGNIYNSRFTDSFLGGVRPVIIVSTSDIPA